MAFSSQFGFFIPVEDDSQIIDTVNDIVVRLEKLPSLIKREKIGFDVFEEKSERNFLIFTKITRVRKFIQVTRSNPDFWKFVQEDIILKKYLSLWSVPSKFSSILLNGNAEKENNKLWTPEDVSLSWGLVEIDLGDEVKEVKGIEIYIWGYGYFFPYTMDEVASTLMLDGFMRELSTVVNEIDVGDGIFTDIVSDTSMIKKFTEFKYPVILQQSL